MGSTPSISTPAALAAAQNVRRSNIQVGHVGSSIKPENFDGYQKNWDNEGVAKAVSSWRVDMSEMIFADDRIVGRINVPGISQESRIVKVSGDSMRPVINEGDYIAVHEIRDMSVIYWGQIYVVVLDDYRMVKYLRRHPKNGMVILRSENKMYDDIELPCDAIRKLFFVDNIIHIDTRM